MKLKYKFWFEKDGEAVLTDLKYRILSEIKKRGSIKEAARTLGISYKKALEHIKVMEKRLGFRVVERERGKGAKLTKEADELLKRYDKAREAFEKVAQALTKKS